MHLETIDWPFLLLFLGFSVTHFVIGLHFVALLLLPGDANLLLKAAPSGLFVSEVFFFERKLVRSCLSEQVVASECKDS